MHVRYNEDDPRNRNNSHQKLARDGLAKTSKNLNLAEAFIRTMEEDSNALERTGRMYCYLIQNGPSHLLGKKFHLNPNEVLTSEDIDKLKSPDFWLAKGPEKVVPPDATPAKINKIMEARVKLLQLVVHAVKGVEIMPKLEEFAKTQMGEDREFTIILKSMFARYYTSSADKASLGLPIYKETTRKQLVDPENRSYPVHIDPGCFTVVLTMPTKNFSKEGAQELLLYDPQCKLAKSWKEGIEVGEHGRQIAKAIEEAGERIALKILPFEYAIMANPLPHAVSQLYEGDRLSIILFCGVH